MAKFYRSNGEELCLEDFVHEYGNSYYIGAPRLVSRVSQNSRITEAEIDRLLKDGIKSRLDVYHILAWKVGKIKHAESEAANEFVYASDWIGAENGIVKRYGKQMDITDFASYIVDNISLLEEKAESDPQRVLECLKGNAPAGLGTVYLITVLYFISRGKWPIYDRFAMMALDAISEGKKPGEAVSYIELPDKNSKKFDTVMENCKQTYIMQLETIFGKDYNQNRDVDRALWVYGHLFKKV